MITKIKDRYHVWRASDRTGGRTPFPWSKMILIDLVLFASSFSFQIVFPFIPFMVQDFFPELSREELGQQTGYIGSAFYVGNFIGSLVWGWISDIWGRRPVLIANVCGMALALLMFGLSQSVAWAIAARFLWGLLDGTLGVCKTCIAEVCDNSNLAAGFSTIGLIGSTCQLLGSFAGGFLAQPARKYRMFETSFFCEFPYLLPCSVGVLVSLVTAMAAWLFLDETFAKDGEGMPEGKRLSDVAAELNSNSSGEAGLGGVNDRVEIDGDPGDHHDDLGDHHDDLGDQHDGPGDQHDGPGDRHDDLGDRHDGPGDHHDDHISSDEGSHLNHVGSAGDGGADDPPTRPDREDMDDNNLYSSVLDEDSPYDPHYRSDSDASIADSITSDSQLLQTALQGEEGKSPSGLANCWAGFARLLRYRVRSSVGSVLACCRLCRSRGGAGGGAGGGTCRWLGLVAVRRMKKLGSDVRTFVAIMKDRTVSLPILLYGLLGLIAIIVNDVFPLLMVANYNHGGYKMDDNEISVILMILATVQMPFLIFIYPRIIRCCGYRKSFGLSTLAFAAACIVLPFSNKILGPLPGTIEQALNSSETLNFTNSSVLILGRDDFSNATNSTPFCAGYLDAVDSVNENSVSRIPAYVWVGLLVIIGFNILTRQTAFTSVMVMVGNSTGPETLGTVNGYAQALVAVSRTIGPLCGALFFAWTEGNGLDWPFNFHLLFYVCAVSAVLVDLLTFLLPKSIEKKRLFIPRTDDHLS